MTKVQLCHMWINDYGSACDPSYYFHYFYMSLTVESLPSRASINLYGVKKLIGENKTPFGTLFNFASIYKLTVNRHFCIIISLRRLNAYFLQCHPLFFSLSFLLSFYSLILWVGKWNQKMETCKSLIKDTETWHKSIIWNIENIYPEFIKEKKRSHNKN